MQHRRRIQPRRLFSLCEQNPQFRRPVRQRETEAREVSMAGADLALDGRDLPAAT
jgi:hypothetical protein